MGTLATSAMCAELVQRCPFGVDLNFAMNRLNQAYQWIESQGEFVWAVKKTTLTIAQAATTVALPEGFDPGKSAYLQGPTGLTITIPYKDWKTNFDYSFFYSATAGPGMYSAWSFYTTFTGGPPISSFLYTAILSPAAAAPGVGGFSLPFVYHALPTTLTSGASTYFPTPAELDYLILLLAEAEAKRWYRIAGAADAMAQAQSYVAPLLDKYRSDKVVLQGLRDQQARTAEANAARAE